MSTDKPQMFNPYAPPDLLESHDDQETFQRPPDESGYVLHGTGIHCGSAGQLPQLCLVTGTSEKLWPTSVRLYSFNSGNPIFRRAGIALLLTGFLVFAITAAGDLWRTWSLSGANYVAGLAAMLAGSLLYYLAQSRQVCVVHGYICRSRQIARFLVAGILVTMWGTFLVLLHAQGNNSVWKPLISLMIVLIATTASEFLILRGLRLRATSLPGGQFFVEGFSERFIDRLRTQAATGNTDPTPQHF
ncbi:MAG: hypothetical protein WCK86_10735 [Planctomycetia bacterium]